MPPGTTFCRSFQFLHNSQICPPTPYWATVLENKQKSRFELSVKGILGFESRALCVLSVFISCLFLKKTHIELWRKKNNGFTQIYCLMYTVDWRNAVFLSWWYMKFESLTSVFGKGFTNPRHFPFRSVYIRLGNVSLTTYRERYIFWISYVY